MQRCGFENNYGNMLANLKENKSHTVAAHWWTLVPAEAGEECGLAELKQARQQGHGRSAGQIITHPDGAATWYSLHIH